MNLVRQFLRRKKPAKAAVEIATVEEMVKTVEPESPVADIVLVPSVETEVSEPTVLSDLGAPVVEKTPVEVPGDEPTGADGVHPQPGELDTQVKTSDFDELFSLKPGEIGYNVTGEDEEEEDDADQKPGAKKGKKKKKRFVEVVYDPDRDVTLVKRKRKRDGAWGDEWEV